MLKITIHDSAKELRFLLEGKLTGPWVDELRQCWETGSSTTAGKVTILDLRDVDFIDAAGQRLLEQMGHAGVRLIASSPLICSLVEEISRAAACGSVEEQPGTRPDALIRSQTAGRHQRAV